MSNKYKVLIVEDEMPVAKLLAFNLESNDFVAHVVYDGEEAVKALKLNKNESCPYDLVILDMMLPKVNGKSLCLMLRSRPMTANIPVIILSARANHDDKLSGFDCGADDYVTKPFVPSELIARIKALLRRHSNRTTQAADIIKVRDLVLDADRMRVSVGGKHAPISVKEFKLLKLFMSNPGVVFRRERLLQIVWGDGKGVDIRTVDVHINRLRNALEVGGSNSYIRTVRGSGYSLNVDDEEEKVM